MKRKSKVSKWSKERRAKFMAKKERTNLDNSESNIDTVGTVSDKILGVSMDEIVQYKAKNRNDITFTLVGQDLTSPRTIAFWILENIETAPEEKLVHAVRVAVNMRDKFGRKQAD